MGNWNDGKVFFLYLQPRHVVSAARHVVHDMLQPDPTARPTATQVRDHPLFWSTERCVEAVR